MFNKFFNECFNNSMKKLFRICKYLQRNFNYKKTDLVERIAYGCMTGTLNKRDLEDISIKQANQILNKNNITIKSLPGYGNLGLKKKEIKPFVKEKTFCKV